MCTKAGDENDCWLWSDDLGVHASVGNGRFGEISLNRRQVRSILWEVCSEYCP